MTQDNLVELKKPEAFVDDPLTAIVRKGAREILAKALETEIDNFLSRYSSLKDDKGGQRVTRNGYLPKKTFAQPI